MSNVSASLGMAQISHLEDWVKRKREIFEEYKKININKSLFNWVEEKSGMYSNRWLSVFLIESIEKRNEIQSVLQNLGIESRRFWKPLHQLQIFDRQKSYISGVSENLFTKGICLPSGVGLKSEEQEEIIQVIRSIN
jgi:UDP-N-acetylbacillosamine transaminase